MVDKGRENVQHPQTAAGLQGKTTFRFHLTAVDMVTKKQSSDITCWQECEKMKPGGDVNPATMENHSAGSSKH